MGIDLGNHHLDTFVRLKVITDFVVTDEWQGASVLYETFLKELKERTNIEPIQKHNFRVQLRILSESGKIESKTADAPPGCSGLSLPKLYRRKHG